MPPPSRTLLSPFLRTSTASRNPTLLSHRPSRIFNINTTTRHPSPYPLPPRHHNNYSTTPSPPTQPSPKPEEPTPYTFEQIQTLSSHPSPHRIIIDLREPPELATTGRIPTARSLPLVSNPDAFHLSPADFEARFGFEKPGAPPIDGEEGGEEGGVEEVVFYCKAGVRSRAGARLAGREWGGVRVGELRGGWMEWEGRGGGREW